MLLRLLVAALTLPPVPAAELGARLTGAPVDALLAVSWRESRHTPVRVHRGDAGRSLDVCTASVRVGWLEPDVDCTTGQWSTRGPMGLMAAYNLRWLGLGRWPWILDIPSLPPSPRAASFGRGVLAGHTAGARQTAIELALGSVAAVVLVSLLAML